ncbi:MAG: hypothetical protein NHG08_00125 [Candidatus Shikimatogenerans sp. JK-2022]|nr:hypothetical protein [Candidatus Shikimatogenerans bostrichidophilus]
MKKINNFLPLITPFDYKLNIDYLSLEKILFYINNLENLNNIILFDNISEYKTFTDNEYIDIINCIYNNNKNNLNIILKINNFYNYYDLINILNKTIYKNIYSFILDFPKNLNNYEYNKDIINNYNKIFNYFKYLKFYFFIKNDININLLIELKKKNKNFIGIIINNKNLIKNIKLIKYFKIIVYNDLLIFNNLNFNIYGIFSPLYYFFLNYINNITLNFYKKNFFLIDNNFYKFINLINILYNKIYYISGIKYLLYNLNICEYYTKKPINNIKHIKEYNKLKKLFKIIINN